MRFIAPRATALALFLGLATVAVAAAPLLSVEPISLPKQTYAQFVEAAKKTYAEEKQAAADEGKTMRTPFAVIPEAAFGKWRDPGAIETLSITYLSDGLRIKGFIWKPRDTQGKRLPVIIVNRGGSRDFGKLTAGSSLSRFALHGFVVIGSQYRGTDGGEGADEFGGADVNDILNLVPVIAGLEYADAGNVFTLGWSRGGMMTYLALKRGLRVKAAAIGSPVVDLAEEGKRRPALTRTWSEMIPKFEKHRNAALTERSPIAWADQLTTPMLIVQGAGDWRADPANTLRLAQKLQAAGRPYELLMYANDDHAVSVNRLDCEERIVRWFRQFLK